MTERREGSTRIIEYREGYEIRIAPAGAWWRKIGGRLSGISQYSHQRRALTGNTDQHALPLEATA